MTDINTLIDGFSDFMDLVPAERMKLRERITAFTDEAIEIAVKFGGIDGAHHKDWVIDQMVRKLAGDRYEKIVKDACAGEDGPDTYEWHTGVAP